MMRLLLGLFSLLFMLYLPALVSEPMAQYPGLVKENPLKSFARSRLAYQNILVYANRLGAESLRLTPAAEKSVEVYSWRDSEGQQHFSDKLPTSNSTVKREIIAVKNQSTGRFAFSQTWVLSFMALVWLLIYLIVHLGIIGANKILLASRLRRPTRRLTASDEPPRVNVWREVDVETTEPHQILGISEFASMEEIKRAYRHAIKQYHPDRVATMGEEIQSLAERKASVINQAYDTMIKKSVSK